MLSTTFNLARKLHACKGEYRKVQEALGGEDIYGWDNPIPLTVVLEHTSLESALWALQCVLPEQEAERDRIARLFACDCADAVLHIVERNNPNEQRPRQAIEVARRFAIGEATQEELAAARAAAWAAARAAARDAAWAAAWDAARDAQKQFFLTRLHESN